MPSFGIKINELFNLENASNLTGEFLQHHLKRRPDHRKVATSQTSELVGKAPNTCNSYPDVIFK